MFGRFDEVRRTGFLLQTLLSVTFSVKIPMNKLFYGDSLDVMRKVVRPICIETVDLC